MSRRLDNVLHVFLFKRWVAPCPAWPEHHDLIKKHIQGWEPSLGPMCSSHFLPHTQVLWQTNMNSENGPLFHDFHLPPSDPVIFRVHINFRKGDRAAFAGSLRRWFFPRQPNCSGLKSRRVLATHAQIVYESVWSAVMKAFLEGKERERHP